MSMDRLTNHKRRFENFVDPAFHAYDMSNEMILRGTGSEQEVASQRAHAEDLAGKAGAELDIIRDIDPDTASKLAEDWRAYGVELQVDAGLIVAACGEAPAY